ncbi:MAG: PhzF family phenazine biosynthesis protein [Holosporales bacterium]|jgi:PhzF family phenazine biosynthesis protein|nr:PhzF family phenazine biosynthesis protein [Holosporales bacterium]
MFFLVDAFTDIPFKGNPAGVCIVNNYPDDQTLQKIARYYNWSEISFLKKLGDSEFQIRWFSPLDEAPLCGHATIAAAHILFSKELVAGNVVNFKHGNDDIAVERTNLGITISFPAKPISSCKKAPFSVKDIIGVENYIEIVKDELLYIIVLETAEDVENASPNFEAIKNIDCRAIAITAKGTGEFDFSSRYFAPKVGIFEDPVCGSMHCRLACYWRSILGKTSFNAYQASKRTGVLQVKLENDIVRITGRAVTVCEITQSNFESAFCPSSSVGHRERNHLATGKAC